jgi:hypothetical protein
MQAALEHGKVVYDTYAKFLQEMSQIQTSLLMHLFKMEKQFINTPV